MKSGWYGIGIFAAGMALGAVLHEVWEGDRPENAPAPVMGEKVPNRSGPRKPGAPERTAHEGKWRTLAAKAKDFGTSQGREFIDGLPPGERNAALEFLFSQSGPGGLSYSEREMVNGILGKWVEENFDEVWQWRLQAGNEATIRYITGQLLDQLVKTDQERALELYLEVTKDDARITSSVPFLLMDSRVGKGAGELASLISQLPFGSGSTGREVRFPEGFDFGSFVPEVVGVAAEKNGRPSIFPSNLFQSWAKVDPEAAWAGYLAMGKQNALPFADPADVVEGAESAYGVQQAAAWTAGKIQASDPDGRKDLVSFLSSSGAAEFLRVNNIADAMPDTIARDRFLADVLREAAYQYSDERQGSLLSEISSPQARLEALHQMNTRSRMPESSDIPDSQLQAWGITRQQFLEVAERK